MAQSRFPKEVHTIQEDDDKKSKPLHDTSEIKDSPPVLSSIEK
jgi:hypothetical protein